jgi:hypothetical protein
VNLLTPYWLYIKIGIVALLCGLCSLGTYKYQKNKYEAKLTKIENDKIKAIATLTQDALEKERINNETTQTLEAKYLEASKKLSTVTANFDKYRSSGGGVYVKSSTCVSEGSANSTASNPVTEGSKPTKQLCELPRVFADTVSATARDADEMRARLDVCLSYAENVEKQRKEMMKGDK